MIAPEEGTCATDHAPAASSPPSQALHLDELASSSRSTPVSIDRSLPDSAPCELERPIVSAECRRLAEGLGAYAGLQVLTPVELVVLPFLCALADKLRYALDMRIDLYVDVTPDCPSCIGDRLALEAALMNLIANARDAMPEGGRLRLQARACGLPNARPGVEISVSDSGAGMSAEAMSQAGRPFFTTKDAVPLAGMGLAATNGFAHRSGGTLALYSPASGGLTAALRLPQFQAILTSQERNGSSTAHAANPPRATATGSMAFRPILE